jgi:hypothetical protein
MAQEGGAQQKYVPPFVGTPVPPSYYGGVPIRDGNGYPKPEYPMGFTR